MRLDLVLVGDRGGRGTLTVSGTVLQVVRIGELLWFKAPRSFYARQPGLPVDLLADHWLEAPAASGQLAQLAAFTRSQEVAGALLSTGEQLQEVPATAGGRLATALSTSTGTLLVSADPPVRPLRAEGSGNALAFSDYDAPVSLERPADVVTAADVAAARRSSAP